MALPKELGGNGKGANPEQLFAMGYSGTRTTNLAIICRLHISLDLTFGKACLLGAIQAVAKNLGKAEMAKRATVRIGLRKKPQGVILLVSYPPPFGGPLFFYQSYFPQLYTLSLTFVLLSTVLFDNACES